MMSHRSLSLWYLHRPPRGRDPDDPPGHLERGLEEDYTLNTNKYNQEAWLRRRQLQAHLATACPPSLPVEVH